ncbi:MAG: hypothetical protein JXL84_22545 [Deltaproteobacteria bacterium]|nr:hypothetical protein [Deltaproteobacteria bacterium]
MGVSVEWQTCFAADGLPSGRIAPDPGVASVKDLLVFMGKCAGFDFFDEKTGPPDKDIEVLLNGKEIWFSRSGPATSRRMEIWLRSTPFALGGD